jgi:G:T-mismatch repair DNA endonuclease (very short patch repair protein)
MHIAKVHLHHQKTNWSSVWECFTPRVRYCMHKPWNYRVMPKRFHQSINTAVQGQQKPLLHGIYWYRHEMEAGTWPKTKETALKHTKTRENN